MPQSGSQGLWGASMADGQEESAPQATLTHGEAYLLARYRVAEARGFNRPGPTRQVWVPVPNKKQRDLEGLRRNNMVLNWISGKGACVT
jgi:hypothetical protein